MVAGTIGASVGYYATAYVNGVRWSYRGLVGRSWPMRVLLANGLAARSIAVEFGPAAQTNTSPSRWPGRLVTAPT